MRGQSFRSASWLACVVLVLASALVACEQRESESPAVPNEEAVAPMQADAAAIAASIASADRMTGDATEDEWRKPQVILEFMGARPGQHLLDYFAGPGYFSEVLSSVVGPDGSIIVYNNPAYAQFSGDKLVARFANDRLPNARVVTTATADLKLDGNSLDAVLFFLSYHDLYWHPKDGPAPFGNPMQVTADLFAAVKPGGVVVVVDHVANAGGETAAVVDSLHRIDPEIVKADFAKAGFAFDAESDVLRHPDDDHSNLVFDESVRHRTDQFVFRFRKPTQE